MQTIPGYTYGDPEVSESPVSMEEFDRLKESVGFTEEDKEYLERAGEFLPNHVDDLFERWRGIFGEIFMSTFVGPDGEVDEEYFERTHKRFVQWVDDTCNRPYDQDWLDYQHEIALRHHQTKKNQTDNVESVDVVPMRYLVTLIHPMSNIRFVLERGDFEGEEITRIEDAWGKSLALQVALWTHPYTKDQDW